MVQKPLVDIMHNIKIKTWYAMLFAFLAQFGFKSFKFVTLFKTDNFHNRENKSIANSGFSYFS